MEYFVIYKPFGYLSQFTKEAPHHLTLADLADFPKDVYSVGRLDKDSEGLLILTNDKKLNQALLHPKNQHQRSYWVQVDGSPDATAITQLSEGISIKINKKIHHTLPAKATILETPPSLPERNPPIRFRASIPTTWIKLSLIEGKNRQVRRMCAKVGFPVLRLVRSSIEKLTLDEMDIGEVRNFSRKDLYQLLKLKEG